MQAIIAKFDSLYNWAKSNSLWPLTFATSCCGIEMICATNSNFDIARFGSEVFRASPRQADLLIVAGTITYKMAPVLLRLYEQMAEPKYVIAMGACATGGGMFADGSSYSVVCGADKIIPVDIYIPMCPPKPEALLDGIIKLQQKIKKESIKDRKKIINSHRSNLKFDENDFEFLIKNDEIEIYDLKVTNEG